MKVKIKKEAKQYITLADMPAVRQLQKDFEEMSKKDFIDCEVQMMARIASKTTGFTFEILKFEIEVSKNGDEVDAWIEAYAYNDYVGFIDFGFYASDAWAACPDNKEDVYNRMYIRFYHQ